MRADHWQDGWMTLFIIGRTWMRVAQHRHDAHTQREAYVQQWIDSDGDKTCWYNIIRYFLVLCTIGITDTENITFDAKVKKLLIEFKDNLEQVINASTTTINILFFPPTFEI